MLFDAAIERLLALGLDCDSIATDGPKAASSSRAVHLTRVQRGVGLTDLGVPEHFVDVVNRPAGFETARPGPMAQVVEVEIDFLELRSRLGRQCSSSPDRREPVRLQHGGFPSAFRIAASMPKTYAPDLSLPAGPIFAISSTVRRAAIGRTDAVPVFDRLT